MSNPEAARPRRPRMASMFYGGVLATGMVLWTITNRLQLPVPSSALVSGVSRLELSMPNTGAPGYRPIQNAQQLQQPREDGCECLLQLHCPRYNFDYPQEKENYCRIYKFRYASAKSCMQWRLDHFGSSTHVVLLGDQRLLYLYKYMRDELMFDSERLEGPKYCKSVDRNWTHSYLQEERHGVQPPEPCRHLSINKLAKLEYYWTDDSRWTAILQKMLDRCRLGSCPSVLVVSSRLDLALRAYKSNRELSLAGVSKAVDLVLPLLERLRAYGVHVWWKLHENLLDRGTMLDITGFNEIIQQHNLKLMSALSRSNIPVWSSTDAIGWMHHHTCENRSESNLFISPDYRCKQPYYLGNWAQKQYMDIVFNFLCGRARSMAQNPCCAGWS